MRESLRAGRRFLRWKRPTIELLLQLMRSVNRISNRISGGFPKCGTPKWSTDRPWRGEESHGGFWGFWSPQKFKKLPHCEYQIVWRSPSQSISHWSGLSQYMLANRGLIWILYLSPRSQHGQSLIPCIFFKKKSWLVDHPTDTKRHQKTILA